jgi:hypothetical protein
VVVALELSSVTLLLYLLVTREEYPLGYNSIMETKQEILTRNIEARINEIMYREINITNYQGILKELDDRPEDLIYIQEIKNRLESEQIELRKDLILLKVNQDQLNAL